MSDINTIIHDATIWLLIGFSIITWVLIVVKAVQTSKATKQSKLFVDSFWSAQNLADAIGQSEDAQGPTARIAQTGFKTLTEANEKTHKDLQQTWSRQDLLERHLRKQILAERRQLEKGSAVLASIGNNAPFIGLFGTVWGIMNSFQSIAISKNTSLAIVAPGIGPCCSSTTVPVTLRSCATAVSIKSRETIIVKYIISNSCLYPKYLGCAPLPTLMFFSII